MRGGKPSNTGELSAVRAAVEGLQHKKELESAQSQAAELKFPGGEMSGVYARNCAAIIDYLDHKVAPVTRHTPAPTPPLGGIIRE